MSSNTGAFGSFSPKLQPPELKAAPETQRQFVSLVEQRLDLMVLKVSSNPNDSVILKLLCLQPASQGHHLLWCCGSSAPAQHGTGHHVRTLRAAPASPQTQENP